ncbi:MAG TPA: hypothetical protein VIY72_08730 [Acidimicrobiales bacterium]
MSRRIDVELTSNREDGTWTWRAAGAKQPKGDLEGALLYEGAKVGDVVRADADFLMDGIVITAVLPPKGARKEPERLEILGPPRRDDQLVTTQLAPKGRGSRDGDRRPRREGGRDGGREGGRESRPGGERARGPRREGDGPGGDRERRARPPRPTRPAPEPKPKPKRLRAARTHRNEVLASLPEEQKPVAEQVLRGGIPAVRQAVEKQNETNKAEGKPEISSGPLLTLAEQLMPALRTAEWRDKAEAALADIDELDLRDLRSVVVASDVAARTEETRELAEKLRVALAHRVDAEHAAWLAEIDETLSGGRVVRALRVSSRPPKAGAPFPPELAARLADETAKALTPDTGADRYATVLDALAYSPVRGQVTPQGIPAEPSDELLAAVRKLASRVPTIAALFGVEAPATPARSGRGRPKGKGKGPGRVPPPGAPPAAPAADAAAPAVDPGPEEPTPEAVVAEAEIPDTPGAPEDTVPDAAAAEVAAPGAPPAEEPATEEPIADASEPETTPVPAELVEEPAPTADDA